VFAHRGLALEAPENTLLAFAKAIAIGVTHIETDVHASRDGVAVISHDPDLSRLTGRSESVSDLTIAELRAIDLGAGQGFASLAEALDAFPETFFNIDIKSPDAVSPTVEAILKHRATQRVLVASFGDARRLAAVARLDGVATSASARSLATAIIASKLGIRPLARRALRAVHAVQVPEKALGMTVTSKRMIRAFHAAGVEVHVWTVNEPSVMRSLLAAGADGVVTDRADLALELLRSIDGP
jgi:glycerophosphoryl diester phosphodiesterase